MRNTRRAIALITSTCAASGAIAACVGDDNVESAPGVDAGAHFDATTDAHLADTGGPVNDAGVDQTAPSDAGTDAIGDAAADVPDTSTACALGDGGLGMLCSDAGCVDIANDITSCGGCGASFVCEAGAVCALSQCQNVAGILGGLRWELPCTSSGGTSCSTSVDGGGVAQVLSTTLSGANGTTYQVTLHFRGIVEQRTYSGYADGGAIGPDGGAGSNTGYFVELPDGGTPPSHSDTFNIYELDISDPPQSYFLNSGTTGISFVWLIDYLATIPMKAGATVTMTADSVEGQEIANQGPDGGPVVVPDVPPAPAPFDGQFVQIDVVSVTAGP